MLFFQTRYPLIDHELLDARRIQVTGYLRIGENRIKVFPRSFREIQVLGKKPWTETATFRWLALGCLALAIGGLVWVISLRRLVRNRTEALDNSLGLLNASYDAVNEGICVVGKQGAIRKTNPRFWSIVKPIQERNLKNLPAVMISERLISDSAVKHRTEFLSSLEEAYSSDTEAREEGTLKMTSCDEWRISASTPCPRCNVAKMNANSEESGSSKT